MGEVHMLDGVPSDWQIVGVGDFNGDGFDDILFRNADGGVTWWQGSVGDWTGDWNNVVAQSADSEIDGIGDFNSDGLSDVLWRYPDGWMTDWLATGTGFAGNWDNVTVQQSADFQVAGIGDFNGDGRSDILWRNADGWVTDWLGSGDGFVGNWDNVTAYQSPDFQVAAIGDFNGDGLDDVLWRNADGLITDWLGSGNSFVGNWGALTANQAGGWQVAGAGDFNGDGRSDILVRSTDGTITDWLGQADGGFVANDLIAMQPVSTDLQVAGIGDFNGDGFSDVLFRDGNGALQMWRGDISGNLLSPLQQLWQDALLNVAEFFTDIAYGDASSDHTDQYSYQPQGSYYEALFPVDTTMDWLADVEAWNGSSFAELLPQNSPYFGVVDSSTEGFSASFGENNFGSMTALDPSSETFLLQMNGLDLVGQWHPGAAPDSVSTDSNSIVIVGHRNEESRVSFGDAGYFSFNPIDSGYDLAASFGSGGGANLPPKVDYNFLTQHEGGVITQGYIPPAGNSSITIGAGVDLGQHNAADLAAAGVSQSIIDQLAPYLGLQGSVATAYLAAHPLSLSFTDAATLSILVERDYARQIGEKYNAASELDFFNLPTNTQTAIVDLAYQYGRDLPTRTPTFWYQITHGDWAGAYQNLLNFGDIYTSRRHDEAELIAKDLQSHRL